MADWTELLPKEIKNPVVLEIRYPKELRGRQPREFEDKLNQELESLQNDNEYIDSTEGVIRELGADSLLLVGVPIQEAWTASEEGGEGKKVEGETVGGRGLRRDKMRVSRVDRRPGPEARDLSIVVHLPPSVASTPEDEESATETVMDLVESSKLGKILLRTFRGAGAMHVGAVGHRYRTIADIGGIMKREDVTNEYDTQILKRIRGR